LPKRDFEKLFSPEEANELIPRLQVLIADLQVAASQVRERIAELSSHDPSLLDKTLRQIIKRYPDLAAPSTRMAEVVEQIESLGCLLKDIDQGLVDFPSDNGEEIIFLCWEYGEPRVIAWHPVDGGFATRKPLPGATKPYLN
jgi:hypothetical protein